MWKFFASFWSYGTLRHIFFPGKKFCEMDKMEIRKIFFSEWEDNYSIKFRAYFLCKAFICKKGSTWKNVQSHNEHGTNKIFTVLREPRRFICFSYIMGFFWARPICLKFSPALVRSTLISETPPSRFQSYILSCWLCLRVRTHSNFNGDIYTCRWKIHWHKLMS